MSTIILTTLFSIMALTLLFSLGTMANFIYEALMYGVKSNKPYDYILPARY